MKFSSFSLLFAFVFGLGYLKSASTDILTLQGSGTLHGTDVFRIDVNGDVISWDGDYKFGGIGTAPSETNYFGPKFPCSLVGSDVAEGAVLVSSDVATGSCIGSEATGELDWLGVSDGSYSSGDIAYYAASGYAIVNTTGTIAIGDILITTSAAAGYSSVDNTPSSGADIGVALSAGSGDDQVLIKIR